MNITRENRIINSFIRIYFQQKINWRREDENKWPDGILSLNNGEIALEITELLHKEDIEHINRRKLDSNESKLQSTIVASLNRTRGDYGGMISVSIDLEKIKLTNSKISKIGNHIGESISNKIREDGIKRHPTRFNFDISQPSSSISVCVSRNWKQIGCDVGYSGIRLINMTSSEIQKIINRKNERQTESCKYVESWLLLVEDLNGSMRDNIDTNNQFSSWYDKILLFRLINDEIIELENETIIPTK